MHNWLIFRGLAREQRHWGSFPDLFSEMVPEARVHALDFPGVGTENDRSSPAHIRGIVEDCRMRWQELRAEHEGPWSILGISLGGMVSMHWCATHPEDFEHLIVINSSTRDLSSPLRRLNHKVIPKLIQAVMEEDAVERERIVLGFTSRMATDIEGNARRAAQYMKDAPIKRRTVLKQILAGAIFKAPDRIDIPTLILAGAQDPLADPGCAFNLSRHLGCALHIHPDAGHDLSLDDPIWIARQVRTWLGGLDNSTSVLATEAAE
jgi:pimeloyl-ACP methyl ester carboxylesterase